MHTRAPRPGLSITKLISRTRRREAAGPQRAVELSGSGSGICTTESSVSPVPPALCPALLELRLCAAPSICLRESRLRSQAQERTQRRLGAVQDFHICSVTTGGNPRGCISLNNSTTYSLVSAASRGPGPQSSSLPAPGRRLASALALCLGIGPTTAEHTQIPRGGIHGLRRSVLATVPAERLFVPGRWAQQGAGAPGRA